MTAKLTLNQNRLHITSIRHISSIRRRGNGRYYVRIFVPTHLRPKFGRSELTRSLRVRSRAEAERLTTFIKYAWLRLMDIAQKEASLSPSDLRRLARDYFNKALEQAEAIRLGRRLHRPAEVEHLIAVHADIEERLADWLSRNCFTDPDIRNAVAAVAKHGGIHVTEDTPQYRMLAHLCVRGLREIHRLQSERWNGQYETKPRDSLFQEPVQSTVPKPPRGAYEVKETSPGFATQDFGRLLEGNTDDSLTTVIAAFQAHHARKWRPRTREKYAANLKVCAEIIGGETQVRSIAKPAIRLVRDTLEKLPRSWKAVYPNLTVAEAAERATQDERRPMEAASVNAYLGSLSSFFEWAWSEGYADSNPVRGIRTADPVHPADKKNPFSIEQLQALFNAPLFCGMRSGWAWKHGGNIVVKDARYWLPLVGLFTGMRLGEILALRGRDIVQGDGLAVINVPGTKTRAAVRKVPIHPELVGLGLLAHCTGKAEDALLFPDFTQKAYSKFFRRLQNSVGLTSPKVTFHSLRHNFADALRAARIQESVAKALIGHSDGSVTERYGNGHPVNVLADAVQSLRYEGLSLDTLNHRKVTV